MVKIGYVTEDWGPAALLGVLPDAVVPTVSRPGDDSTVESG